MPYIKRDSNGQIQAVSFVKTKDFQEKMECEDDAAKLVLSMLNSKNLDAIASDLEMARVVEDLIDTLVAKSIISINDLPQAVQLKLLKRKNYRLDGDFNTSKNELINL